LLLNGSFPIFVRINKKGTVIFAKEMEENHHKQKIEYERQKSPILDNYLPAF
jgi:hypothetical protein